LVSLGELDIVALLWFHVGEPAQVDDETLVNSRGDLAIAKGVAANLGVLGILFRQREIALRIRVVEWEGKWVIGVSLSVNLDILVPAKMVGILLDAVHKVSVEDDLTECHGLLSHVAALVVKSMLAGAPTSGCC
jgi:hypothetical protein